MSFRADLIGQTFGKDSLPRGGIYETKVVLNAIDDTLDNLPYGVRIRAEMVLSKLRNFLRSQAFVRLDEPMVFRPITRSAVKLAQSESFNGENNLIHEIFGKAFEAGRAKSNEHYCGHLYRFEPLSDEETKVLASLPDKEVGNSFDDIASSKAFEFFEAIYMAGLKPEPNATYIGDDTGFESHAMFPDSTRPGTYINRRFPAEVSKRIASKEMNDFDLNEVCKSSGYSPMSIVSFVDKLEALKLDDEDPIKKAYFGLLNYFQGKDSDSDDNVEPVLKFCYGDGEKLVVHLGKIGGDVLRTSFIELLSYIDCAQRIHDAYEKVETAFELVEEIHPSTRMRFSTSLAVQRGHDLVGDPEVYSNTISIGNNVASVFFQGVKDAIMRTPFVKNNSVAKERVRKHLVATLNTATLSLLSSLEYNRNRYAYNVKFLGSESAICDETFSNSGERFRWIGSLLPMKDEYFDAWLHPKTLAMLEVMADTLMKRNIEFMASWSVDLSE